MMELVTAHAPGRVPSIVLLLVLAVMVFLLVLEAHRTEWGAATSKYRCVRFGRSSKHL